MSRRKGRILAFQALYSWDVGGVKEDELLSLSWANNDKKTEVIESDNADFARLLIKGTISNINEIDEMIKSHLSASWTMERLNKVSLAVLRLSVYSLLYQKDLHSSY